MTDDSPSVSAVTLAEPDRGHALLGCDWGTLVHTVEDPVVCDRPAVQRVVLHTTNGNLMIKLCDGHTVEVLDDTP